MLQGTVPADVVTTVTTTKQAIYKVSSTLKHGQASLDTKAQYQRLYAHTVTRGTVVATGNAITFK